MCKPFLEQVPKAVLSGIGLFLVVAIVFFVGKLIDSFQDIMTGLILGITVILTTQGLFTLCWMLYAWEDPEKVDHHKSPTDFSPAKFSFTALIPARHESQVIEDTIRAVDRIRYPTELKEILVLCRIDDHPTIEAARSLINTLNNPKVKVLTFNDFPINKPHSLNIGLKSATHEVIAVFDAEDEPHADIYQIVNTLLVKDNVDVVQSGVQLMNINSSWYSLLNCLEYFFWFKSGLHFFTNMGGVTPLGGNTVFFKKEYLEAIEGWDESCLTEDADVGFRLTKIGAITRVVYDERHVTQEETPPSLSSFIRQRTRWNQGFMQMLGSGRWAALPQFKQKITGIYILLSPMLQAWLMVLAPISILLSFTVQVPILVSLLSFIPLALLFLQLLVLAIGYYEFGKSYQQPFSIRSLLILILAFYPYQLVLMFASLRSIIRLSLHINSWEKTTHVNMHRTVNPTRPKLALLYAR